MRHADRLALRGRARGDAEVQEARVPGALHDHVAGRDVAMHQLEAVVRWIEEHRPDAPVLDYEIELL